MQTATCIFMSLSGFFFKGMLCMMRTSRSSCGAYPQSALAQTRCDTRLRHGATKLRQTLQG